MRIKIICPFVLSICLLALTSLLVSVNSASTLQPVLASTDADISGDFWVNKTSTPAGGPIFGLAAVNGKIYAFESYIYNGDGERYATCDEYDPTTDTWTAKTPMRQPRVNFATAVYENKIYVFGGQKYSGYPAYGTVEVYDPATDRWSYAAAMPEPKVLMCANVVNGKIYVIGGTTSPTPNTTQDNGLTNTTQVYDPNTNTWSTAAPIPYAICSYASAVANGKIYLFSGLEIFTEAVSNTIRNYTKFNFFVTRNTHIYDPATDAWSFGKQLPCAAAGAVACATTGEMAPAGIYLFGGGYITFGNPFNVFGRHLQTTQVYNPSTDLWINGTTIPENSDYYSAVTLNDTMYVMWGCNTEKIPRVTKTPDYDEPPRMMSISYQYIPFGYGTFEPIPTPTPTPSTIQSPTSLESSLLPLAAVAVVVVCVVAAGLAFKRAKRVCS